jgi:hypothetical protein
VTTSRSHLEGGGCAAELAALQEEPVLERLMRALQLRQLLLLPRRHRRGGLRGRHLAMLWSQMRRSGPAVPVPADQNRRSAPGNVASAVG